jgi:hypothetical protein
MVIGRHLEKSKSLHGKFVGPQTGFGQLHDFRSDKFGCYIRGRRQTKLCTHRLESRVHVLIETDLERNFGELTHVLLLVYRREHITLSATSNRYHLWIRSVCPLSDSG